MEDYIDCIFGLKNILFEMLEEHKLKYPNGSIVLDSKTHTLYEIIARMSEKDNASYLFWWPSIEKGFCRLFKGIVEFDKYELQNDQEIKCYQIRHIGYFCNLALSYCDLSLMHKLVYDKYKFRIAFSEIDEVVTRLCHIITSKEKFGFSRRNMYQELFGKNNPWLEHEIFFLLLCLQDKYPEILTPKFDINHYYNGVRFCVNSNCR